MSYKINFQDSDEVVKHLSTSYADSIHRIEDLIQLHSFLSEKYPEVSHRLIILDDLLRLCVIYLHQCIEDLIRHLSILKGSNPLILFKHTEEENQSLRYSGININSVSEFRNHLTNLGFDDGDFQRKCGQLEKLFSRRHKIVHHGDRKDSVSESFLFSPSSYESISVEFVEENLNLIEEIYADLHFIMGNWIDALLEETSNE